MPVSLDTDSIRMITLFENMTGSGVRDCLVDDVNNTVYLIIEEGMVGMAIGKNGNSVKNVENIIKKNIKLFEFSKDLNVFVKNLIPQARETNVKNENMRTVVEVRVDRKNRSIVIGRDGKNIKMYKEILHRNHGVNDVVIR